MTFAEKIKELRKQKNLSQTDLGKAVGVSLRTVRGWEVEGRYPKQHDIYGKLAEVLGCDVSYLMSDTEAFIKMPARSLAAVVRKTQKNWYPS